MFFQSSLKFCTVMGTCEITVPVSQKYPHSGEKNEATHLEYGGVWKIKRRKNLREGKGVVGGRSGQELYQLSKKERNFKQVPE